MRILAARLLLLASAACLPLWTTGCKQHLSIAAPAPPTLPSVASATYTYSKDNPVDVSKPFIVTKGYTTQDYSNDLKNYNEALKKYSDAITDYNTAQQASAAAQQSFVVAQQASAAAQQASAAAQQGSAAAQQASDAVIAAQKASIAAQQTSSAALAASLKASTQLDQAKFYRNNIIWGEMTAIERVYTVYHSRLFSDKNAISITSDAMTLGLTAAATIAGNPATKTALSALGTAFAGLGLSIDKNYFSQQSFQILGLAMQTRRDKVRLAIGLRLSLCDVPTYSLEQGQRDLMQYFGAGTLDSALQELQEEAASATTTASAIVTNPGTPPPTTTAPPSTCPITPPPPAEKPTFTPRGDVFSTPQSVAITSTTPGAKIYYTTDGSTPTTGSNAYTTAVAVSSTETIQAIATAPGYTTSALATAAYTITQIPATAPAFSPVAGTYSAPQSVTIFSTTPGSTIYYTTDGSTPTTTTSNTVFAYTTPVAVSANQTIKAIAAATGYTTSPVASAMYTITPFPPAAPSFSLAAGTYPTAKTVVISSPTPNSTIYYTTDGRTTPTTTTSSTVFSATAPVTVPVSATETIQAIAVANGAASAPVSVTYTITPPAPGHP